MSSDDEEPDNDPCSFKNSNEGSCQREGNSNEDALFFACERGHADCLKQITTDSSSTWFASDVNIIMKTGWTPLTKACSKGRLEVVKWLLHECHADPAKPSGETRSRRTPLAYAALYGHIEICYALWRLLKNKDAIDVVRNKKPRVKL